MDSLKKTLLYMGLSQRDYLAIKDEVIEGNRRNMIVFSALTSAALFFLVIATFFVDFLGDNRLYYSGALIVTFLLIPLCAGPARRWPFLTTVAMYIFFSELMLLGIVLGTINTPDEFTVSFLIFLFAVPMLYLDMPLRMDLAILISIIIYIFLAYRNQEAYIFRNNMVNILPYGTVSILLSTYMMLIKAKRYSFEQKARYLSESDQLTGLLNRRSYDENVQRLREKPLSENLKICAFDVNGLKNVNDNLGHRAGDELISGAAHCIDAVFGRYGKCYRTGGDEYMAILDNLSPSIDELKEMLVQQTMSWKGSLVSGMSISVGIVEPDGHSTVDELLHMADQKMYDNKEEYYRKNGLDRRRSRR